jgi:hypothetical protein
LNKTLEEQEEAANCCAIKKKRFIKCINKRIYARMNDSKIDKGIQAVNLKLNELKGQKENIEEQVALQKQEIELATKKLIY